VLSHDHENRLKNALCTANNVILRFFFRARPKLFKNSQNQQKVFWPKQKKSVLWFWWTLVQFCPIPQRMTPLVSEKFSIFWDKKKLSLKYAMLCDLNFKVFMQFVCKQINYIVRQISKKDHILLIIQTQTSGFAVGRLNNTPLAW
jgi:hypothetical protein